MTTRGLFAVFALSVGFTVIGFSTLLWAGVVRTRGEALRLIPLAFTCGLAATTVFASICVVLGIAVVAAAAFALAAALTAIAFFLHRRGLPRAPEDVRGASLTTAALAALVALVLAAYGAAAFSHGLSSYDSWAFWTQKALVLFHFDGLDVQNFTTLPGESYPLVIPVFQSLVFEFAGATDAAPIELGYVVVLAAFIGAVRALLHEWVRPELVWPFLLLILLLPQIRYLALQPIGDLPLQYFFVLAALCLFRWIRDNNGPSFLLVYALLVAAAMSTKREGALLVASLVFSAVFAERRLWRTRALPILGATAAAFATTVPWRYWITTHALAGSEGTGAGPTDLLDQSDRIVPAMSIVVRLIFDYGLWSVAPLAAFAALVLGLLGPERRFAFVVVATSALVAASFVWILWSIPELGLGKDDGSNPMPRAVGAIVLLWCAVAPIFFELQFGALAGLHRARRVPWGVAMIPTAAYLLAIGIRGDLAFASSGCSPPAVAGAPIDAVFGHVAGYEAARTLQLRAEGVGYQGIRISPDTCRRLRVYVPGVSSLEGGRSLREEARRAGFTVVLERGS